MELCGSDAIKMGRRRQRSEFFELHKKIAQDLWTPEQRPIFIKILNGGLNDPDELQRKFTRDADLGVSRKCLVFDELFSADDLGRDMMFPMHLGLLKPFNVVSNGGQEKTARGEAGGLINGLAASAKNHGDYYVERKMYNEALFEYFSAIRLVPYKKAIFYTMCAICYYRLGCEELAVINSYMAAVIDAASLDAWIILANSAVHIIETHGLLNTNHRVGRKEKEVAARFARMAYDAISSLCHRDEFNVVSKVEGIMVDLMALKSLLLELEEKKMVSTLDDMFMLFVC